MQSTVFRAWTWSPDSSSLASEPVPGLRAVLSSVGLASYSNVAELWCLQMGAAFLADIADDAEMDDFLAALSLVAGLTMAMRRRLRLALQSSRGVGETIAGIGRGCSCPENQPIEPAEAEAGSPHSPSRSLQLSVLWPQSQCRKRPLQTKTRLQRRCELRPMESKCSKHGGTKARFQEHASVGVGPKVVCEMGPVALPNVPLEMDESTAAIDGSKVAQGVDSDEAAIRRW